MTWTWAVDLVYEVRRNEQFRPARREAIVTDVSLVYILQDMKDRSCSAQNNTKVNVKHCSVRLCLTRSLFFARFCDWEVTRTGGRVPRSVQMCSAHVRWPDGERKLSDPSGEGPQLTTASACQCSTRAAHPESQWSTDVVLALLSRNICGMLVAIHCCFRPSLKLISRALETGAIGVSCTQAPAQRVAV